MVFSKGGRCPGGASDLRSYFTLPGASGHVLGLATDAGMDAGMRCNRSFDAPCLLPRTHWAARSLNINMR